MNNKERRESGYGLSGCGEFKDFSTSKKENMLLLFPFAGGGARVVPLELLKLDGLAVAEDAEEEVGAGRGRDVPEVLVDVDVDVGFAGGITVGSEELGVADVFVVLYN